MKLVRCLLPINQDGTTDACAAIAFALAKRFRIEVQVLHCATPPAFSPVLPSLDPLASNSLREIELGRKQVSCERRHAKAWWKKITKSFPKVTSTFASPEGSAGTLAAKFARFADLTIVPSVSQANESFWSEVRNGALLSSGRPMLVVPPDAERYGRDTIVVAWKDRPETVRALVAAAPFLAKAKLVHMISVTEPDQDKSSLIEITHYLNRAGIAAKSIAIPESSAIGEILVAESAKTAMLVMGGSGRSQLSEWAFGGATNYILSSTTVPTLMMH